MSVYQVYASDRTTSVVDLNDGTIMSVFECWPLPPVVDETWFFPDSAPDATLSQAFDRPRQWHFGVHIYTQASVGTLLTKVLAVRDAFLSSTNYLGIAYDTETTRFFLIYPTRLDPVASNDDEWRQIKLSRQILSWRFNVTVKHARYGDSVPYTVM